MAARTILGKWPAGTPGSGYGLKISFPGVNANAASDGQLMFSSDWAGTLAILQTGAVPMNTGGVGGNASVTISFPTQAFVPAARFAVDPTGGTTSGFPGMTPTGFLVSQSRRVDKSYLDVQLQQSSFTATLVSYGETTASAQSAGELGWPLSITLYYVIFRLPLG